MSICIAIVFAGLYFLNPKTVAPKEMLTVTNIVHDTVTNYLVTHPSSEYIQAKTVFDAMTNAPMVGSDQILFAMKDVKINYEINDAIKKVLSEDEIKAKFELALRRNNVSINPKSLNTVSLIVDGLWDDTSGFVCYSITTTVGEPQFILRAGLWRQSAVAVWSRGSYGYAGKQKANEGMLNQIEKMAELFANDFLSANPK